MFQSKMLVAAMLSGLAVGCSQLSENQPDESAVPIQSSAAVTKNLPVQPVEVNASAKQLSLPEYRPIYLPQPPAKTTVETFAFGDDAPVAEPLYVASLDTTSKPSPRFAPTYPDRPVPIQGMTRQEVLEAAGEPAQRMTSVGSEVWDYGTYRVFFSAEQVAFTRVW